MTRSQIYVSNTATVTWEYKNLADVSFGDQFMIKCEGKLREYYTYGSVYSELSYVQITYTHFKIQ